MNTDRAQLAALAASPATLEQPAPTGDGPEVWPVARDLLRADLAGKHVAEADIAALLRDTEEREAVGRERYGTPLRAYNGRDAAVDAYQELLDTLAYVTQAQIETAPGGDMDEVPGELMLAGERAAEALLYLRRHLDRRRG